MQQDPELDYEDGNRFGRALASAWHKFARSGALTAVVLLLLLGAVTGIYMAHKQGRIHQLTTVTENGIPTAQSARPGGQDVLHLFRGERIGSVTPEFSSATLLPGDGMLLLQATLALPGRGDVPLLQATSDARLEAGQAIDGAAFSVLAQSRAGSQWTAPVELVAGQPAVQSSSDIVPDGSRAVAHFTGGAAGQQGVQVTVETSLTGRGLELTLSARNSGTSPRALTAAWQPRFLAPAAGLSALTVMAPEGANGLSRELPLGARSVDETYTDLKHSFLSTGPEVRLRNHADGYTLRLTALTPSIRSLHVQAARDGQAVLLALSTAGGKDGPEARTIVAPGETLQWRVRVEALPELTSIYAPSAQ